jgi:hypothetical protein
MKLFPVAVRSLTLLVTLLATPVTAQPPALVAPVAPAKSGTPAEFGTPARSGTPAVSSVSVSSGFPASPASAASPVILASPVSPVSSSSPTSSEPPVSGSVLGYPAALPSAAPVYSPFGYITNGYYKSGGVFVGGNGSFPFDSGNILLGGTDGLARVSGSYQLVVMPGAAGNGFYPGCGGSFGLRYR